MKPYVIFVHSFFYDAYAIYMEDMCNYYENWEKASFDLDLSVYEFVIKSQDDRLKNKNTTRGRVSFCRRSARYHIIILLQIHQFWELHLNRDIKISLHAVLFAISKNDWCFMIYISQRIPTEIYHRPFDVFGGTV